MSKFLKKGEYRREHLDNSVESARTTSRYSLDQVTRTRFALLVSYAEYLDAAHPGWRDFAVKQVNAHADENGIDPLDLVLKLHKFSIQLGTQTLRFAITEEKT